MAGFDLAKATSSDLTNKVTDFAVVMQNTDAATGQKETIYQNSNWPKQWAYFNAVADLKSAIILKAMWNVGKGYNTDAATQARIDHIVGWGKETFEDIIFNSEIIKRISGDFFAEIIRDVKNEIINLKPLDTGSMRIVVDDAGIIVRYEQTNKTPNSEVRKFKPVDIFHICHNRLADQIHGISDIDAVEKTILAEEESFNDVKRLMHTQARPMIIFKLGTDNATKINDFVAKMDKAVSKGENIYVPFDDNTFTFEVVQINPSEFVLAWRNDIRNKFYRAIGLPQIVPGASGGGTESETKVIYLAFEQIVEHEQRFLERQIWQQLGFKINLNPPATLAQNLQQDISKDSGNMGFQPSDMAVKNGQ